MKIGACLGALSFVALTACSGTSTGPFSTISDGPDAGQGDATAPGSSSSSGGPSFNMDAGEAAPPCVNLQCKRVSCPGTGTTSISGTVWDPAGKNPLYNAIVYIPNAPIDPISHGATCDKCDATASGFPIATALTDTGGNFTLKDVPVGNDIPLVLQIGKWRRQIKVPQVSQCVDNKVTDKNQTRLPKDKTEGDMPLIALTGGCDPVHTLIQKIGVAATELTDENGQGTVHVFSGKDNQNAGIATATDAYAFWGDLKRMMKYDIIINECECSPYPRDSVGPGYANMAAYLNAGGRAFNSHYHINFFGETGKADPSLYSAADWTLWGGSSSSAPYLIDTSFPKGKALADWMQNLPTVSGWGAGIKTSPYGQLASYMVGDIKATKTGLSQRWIYPQAGGSAGYISINTPVNAAPDAQCGRAVLTDLHVGSGGASMVEQEAALEFMLFDLSSCVLPDGQPPAPPPPVR